MAVARSSDPDLADFFDAAAKDSSRRSTLLQKQVQELMLSEQEKKLFDEIGVQRGHYLKGRDTIFALKREGRTDEANALLQQQFLPQSEAYANRLDALLAHQREQVNQLAQASKIAEQVAQGSALVDKAGETMNEVVNSIRRVTDIMGEISAASNEQSTGVAQVSEAVTSMDQSTQQNAALVEEMAAAASSLRVQSSELVEAVSVFRLSVGQGSATATTIAHAAPPAPSLAPATTKPTARPAAAAKAAAPAAPPPVAAPRPAAAAATPAARSKAGTPPALTAAPPAKATQAASEDDWETF